MSDTSRQSTIATLLDWFDSRTGYRDATQEALYERIPCGARWRYVFGSTLVFAFVTQVITGLFLWMAYSPSSQTAWESVYYIQYEMQAGWLLRGVHHFMAQAMIVLLALHLLQVIIDGAYKAPREVNFWLGLVLMQIVLGLSLTGYLLPWDQKGYWATNVATNLMTLVPWIGDDLQKLVVGGNQYGHHTLTRFFALHAGVLPALLVGFLALHLALFRKHGIHAVRRPKMRDSYFWPDQVLKDAVACLAVFVVVLLLTIQFDVPAMLAGDLNAHDHGAELGAPADPAKNFDAARPEWYFLFLFQLLKYFPGKLEIVGAIILPGVVMFVLFFMPITAKWKQGHRFNVGFISAMLVGAVVLTGLALHEDYYSDKAPEHLAALEEAERDSERIVELIQHRDAPDEDANMVPRTGAVSLLRGDPLTQGPVLFERNCLSCHAYPTLDEAKAEADPKYMADREISAPNLEGFATRGWIEGLLDPSRVDSPHYFGNTAHKEGRMAQWVKQEMPKLIRSQRTSADLSKQPDEPVQELIDKLKITQHTKPSRLKAAAAQLKEIGDAQTLAYSGMRVVVKLVEAENNADQEDAKEEDDDGDNTAAEDSDDEEPDDEPAEEDSPATEILVTAFTQDFDDIVAALSAQARLPEQAEIDRVSTENGQLARGLSLMRTTCAKGCHKIGDYGQHGLAPDLTGYGSWEWLMGMIGDPTHERFYRGENDRMPSFGESLDKPEENQMTAHQISMISDWLRKDYVDSTTKFAGHAHTQAQADEALLISRLTTAPAADVVGASPPAEETELAKAERLFKQNCAACHNHTNEHGVGIVSDNPSAPNLYRFASREWLAGLVDPERITSDEYFGNTKHSGGSMAADFVEVDVPELDEDGEKALANAIIALSAEAALPYQAELDKQAMEDGSLEAGRTALTETFENYACTDCHTYGDEGIDDAPDLTGYGSAEWLKAFIANPEDNRFYGKSNDRMPRFAGHADAAGRLLTDEEIELLSRLIRGEL